MSAAMIAALIATAVAPADTLYDNGAPNGVGAPSNNTEDVFGYRRTLLDDFIVPEGETWRVTAFHHYHVWNTLPPGSGTGMEIAIWTDRNGEPWRHDFDLIVTQYEETGTGNIYFNRPEAESWTTLLPVDLGPGHYWFDATIVGPETNFWLQTDLQNSEPWVNYQDIDGLIPSLYEFGVHKELSFSLEGTRVEPLRFSYPGGLPESIEPHGDSFRVQITAPKGGGLDLSSPLLHYDVGGGFVVVPLERVSFAVYDVVFPPIACGSAVEYYLSARTTDDVTYNDPAQAPGKLRTTVSAIALVVAFEDNMEGDPGWTIDHQNVVEGGWERGTPMGALDAGSTREPGEDSDGSGQAWVTGLDPGTDLDGGPARLVSPLVDLEGAADAVISYARWFTDDFELRVLEVELSNDGGATWVPVEREQFRVWWRERTFRAGSLLPLTDEMRLRFTAQDAGDFEHTEAGLDAVRVLRLQCGVGCPSDLDADGSTGFTDLLLLLSAWGPCPGCPEDLDGDDEVGFNDLLILLAAWGPCP